MPDSSSEHEQLIADLLEEAHGLRMKYEEFSLYTESKVAEFVTARKALTEERNRAVHNLSLTEQDLHVLRQRQEEMQQQLVEVTAQFEKLTRQRDQARARIAALESSRAVRIAVRLRKMLRRS